MKTWKNILAFTKLKNCPLLPWAAHMAKNSKSMLEIGRRNSLLYLLCGHRRPSQNSCYRTQPWSMGRYRIGNEVQRQNFGRSCFQCWEQSIEEICRRIVASTLGEFFWRHSLWRILSPSHFWRLSLISLQKASTQPNYKLYRAFLDVLWKTRHW